MTTSERREFGAERLFVFMTALLSLQARVRVLGARREHGGERDDVLRARRAPRASTCASSSRALPRAAVLARRHRDVEDENVGLEPALLQVRAARADARKCATVRREPTPARERLRAKSSTRAARTDARREPTPARRLRRLSRLTLARCATLASARAQVSARARASARAWASARA